METPKTTLVDHPSTRTCTRVTALIILTSVLSSCTFRNDTNEFHASWSAPSERIWVGPDFWANRLQDWKVVNGRLECVSAETDKPMRTVHLLTRSLGPRPGRISMGLLIGLPGPFTRAAGSAAAGFLIGAGPGLDYRAAALVHHSPGPGGGLFAGLDGSGRLFYRDFTREDPDLIRSERAVPWNRPLRLEFEAEPESEGYRLSLRILRPGDERELDRLTRQGVEPSRLTGGLALVSHPGHDQPAGRFWFDDWTLSGSKIEIHEDRNCGPILSVQYTLSRNTLKLTAQLMPLAEEASSPAHLQVLENGGWETLASAPIIRPGWTAAFRIDDWPGNRDVPYRVLHVLESGKDTEKSYIRTGTVKRNPVEKPELVVAAFTGNHNVSKPGVDSGTFPWSEGLWFPHADIVEHVLKHDPDILFFSGDQVYEGASPTRADTGRLELDYLYKWYLWCWAFRDLTGDRPSVCTPDDHDVFHGNLWGAGGKATDEGLSGAAAQDSGGYKYSPDFVNMVERTQTSHLPDPYDPRPLPRGIGVYYCRLDYGGVSFAVIEDRKFKSPPKLFLPRARIVNGWPQNPEFDARRDADAPGARLLGERQLMFLEDWISDWEGGTWMKVILSQTLFSNVATLPEGSMSGAVIPRLEILPHTGYAENDRIVADMDSNGWPPGGRNAALRILRKGFAIHICGDQHLGSTIQYGIDDWRDAGFALCVPSIANFWPRRWYPKDQGQNPPSGAPRYAGDFLDGFGNRMTVHAVSNPTLSGKIPAGLHDMSPGYGIVRLNRLTREIVFENWPRWSDPDAPEAAPYAGWPVRFNQEDNYGSKPVGYLPSVTVEGLHNPVVKLVLEPDNSLVYTMRLKSNTFRPKVFEKGTYTLIIGEPGTGNPQSFTGLKPESASTEKALRVTFAEKSPS